MRTEQGVSLGKRIQYGAGGEWTVGRGRGGGGLLMFIFMGTKGGTDGPI